MSRRDLEDNDPYVVIEQRSTSVMPFIIGLALGAGAALLFARNRARKRAATSSAGRSARASWPNESVRAHRHGREMYQTHGAHFVEGSARRDGRRGCGRRGSARFTLFTGGKFIGEAFGELLRVHGAALLHVKNVRRKTTELVPRGVHRRRQGGKARQRRGVRRAGRRLIGLSADRRPSSRTAFVREREHG